METDVQLCCRHLERIVPDLKFIIRRLARDDVRFKAICKDYSEAICAAELLEKNKAKKSQAPKELQRLAEDLLSEALRYANDHMTSMSGSGTSK
ncbi:MAG: hypothetical protein ACR2O0_08985 [Rhizobiaceae bacterium]